MRPSDLETRPVAALVPYARNSRTHSDEQVAQIAASITEFGFTNPVLIDADGGIIAGHGRVLAAKSLGLADVPVLILDHLTETQRRAYVIADNKLGLNAGWDDDALRAEIEALSGDFDLDLLGFGDDELAAILNPPSVSEADPDETPEAPEVPVTQAGDVWIMGSHRVRCGDSTSAEHVRALMGDAKAQMVFTDPPYGVDYTGGAKKRDRLKGDHVGTDIYSLALPHLSFAADNKAALYLWYADGHAAAAAAAGYQIVAQIIWAKNHAQFMTSAHYKGKHEPCYYGHRRGHASRWHGPNNEVTLWEHDRSARNDFHPTQKPVALAERAIRNSSQPGQIVLDLFLGGGTTLIASESEGRRCFGMEMNPAYVDVCVLRWEQFTDRVATLEATGQTFREVSDERRLAAKAA